MIIDKTAGTSGQPPLAGVKQPIPASAAIVKVGTVLDVVVFARLGNQQYDLRSNHLRLLASSEQALQTGTRQQLLITGIRPDGSVTARPVQVSSTFAHELSPMILQRLGSATAPQNLVQLIQQLGQNPGSLGSLYAQLVAILPKRQERMDAHSLRKWLVESSGLSSTATAGAPAGNAQKADLKTLLLTLMSENVSPRGIPEAGAKVSLPPGYSAWSEEVTELFRLGSGASTSAQTGSLYQALQGALSRLESQQLLYLQAKHEGFFQLLFDIPVLGQDRDHVWQGCIQRDSDRDQSALKDAREERWSVCLSTELQGLGLIAIRLQYSMSETEIVFYSTQGNVCEQISPLLEPFSRRLQQLGLPLPRLSICHGRLPEQFQPQLDIDRMEIIA